jgi:hypothetical protein
MRIKCDNKKSSVHTAMSNSKIIPTHFQFSNLKPISNVLITGKIFSGKTTTLNAIAQQHLKTDSSTKFILVSKLRQDVAGIHETLPIVACCDSWYKIMAWLNMIAKRKQFPLVLLVDSYPDIDELANMEDENTCTFWNNSRVWKVGIITVAERSPIWSPEVRQQFDLVLLHYDTVVSNRNRKSKSNKIPNIESMYVQFFRSQGISSTYQLETILKQYHEKDFFIAFGIDMTDTKQTNLCCTKVDLQLS